MSDHSRTNIVSQPKGEGVPSSRFLDEEQECVGIDAPALEYFFEFVVFGIVAMIVWCVCKFFSAPPIICIVVPIICGGTAAQHMMHLHRQEP